MKKLSTCYSHFENNVAKQQIDDEESTQCSSSKNLETFNKEGFNMSQVIGSFSDAFIILYYDEKIYFVDQHAASEKSLYVRFVQKRKFVPTPYEGTSFQVQNIYVEVLAEQQQTLKQLGWAYEIGERGPVLTNVKLTSVPSIFDRKCKQQEFQQILDGYFQSSMQQLSKTQKQTIATIVCHNAYKVGDHLNRHDMRDLIDTLFRMSGAFNCPHGRPIIICLGAVSSFMEPICQTRQYTLQ